MSGGRGDPPTERLTTHCAFRTPRRRLLTKVAACGCRLATGVPVCTTLAQETHRSSVGEGKEVSIGERLASYTTSLRYEDLPEEVVRIAKRTYIL